MKLWMPEGADTLFLTDVRQLSDANRDAKKQPGPDAASVFPWHPLGVAAFGEAGWNKVARASLFEFSQVVTRKERAKAKDELHALLAEHRFEYIVVQQNRSKSAKKVWHDNYAQASHSGTVSWAFFDAPDSLAGMQGTHYQTLYGTLMGITDPGASYTQDALTHRWLCAVANKVQPFEPPAATTHSEPGPQMLRGLGTLLRSAIAGTPIAIDIESYSTKDLITVIGLSDGETTCGVPWEPFQPWGQSYIEPGYYLAEEGQLVRRILASAKTVIGHNILRFDIPYLARKGIPVAGTLFDSYLWHGVLLNQYRHGLQQCVAAEFVVTPWKSLHRQHAASSGLSIDDAESWICNPQELRKYNVKDVFFNWWLAKQLAVYAGVAL
jgi:hypothetical protein